MHREPKDTAPLLQESHRPGEPSGWLTTLEQDRDKALGQVRELEEAARSIREKGFTAESFESISSVGPAMERVFRRHEELEESRLFPELRKVQPDTVRMFIEEHREARSLFVTLLSIIRDIEGGRIHGGSVGDLLRTIGELVTMLRRHIIHEGDVLAPLVRRSTRGREPGYHGN